MKELKINLWPLVRVKGLAQGGATRASVFFRICLEMYKWAFKLL